MLKRMRNRIKSKKGQSTLEYAILIVIIIGALLSIQVYIKRGIQGRLKSSADDIGDQFSVGNTNMVSKTSTSSNISDIFTAGESEQILLDAETTTTNVTSNIIKTDQEYWGN